MGDFETKISVFVESSVQYHPFGGHVLTIAEKNAKGQYLAGSFTGAVSS